MNPTKDDLIAMEARLARNRAKKTTQPCEACDGKGYFMEAGLYDTERCSVCDGTGKHFGRGGAKDDAAPTAASSGEAVISPGVDTACPAEAITEHSSITCEADQHKEILKWASGNCIAVRHSRMDTEHGEGNGEPDFIFMKDGRVCVVEQKFGKNKPTKAQRDRMAEYEASGVPGAFSLTVAETIAFAKEHLMKGDDEN